MEGYASTLTRLYLLVVVVAPIGQIFLNPPATVETPCTAGAAIPSRRRFRCHYRRNARKPIFATCRTGRVLQKTVFHNYLLSEARVVRIKTRHNALWEQLKKFTMRYFR